MLYVGLGYLSLCDISKMRRKFAPKFQFRWPNDGRSSYLLRPGARGDWVGLAGPTADERRRRLVKTLS